MAKRKLSPAKRALALEEKIRDALWRHGLKLRRGFYLRLGVADPCCCAIGAAVAAAASDRRGLARMQTGLKCKPLNGQSIEGLTSHAGTELHKWAAGVVNDGLTVRDLIDLEEGFEGEAMGHDIAARPTSAFYKLGERLRTRAQSTEDEQP